ncbi:MAG TPA: polyprenyl synthetase family protein [Acidimicrobiales bacterium]|nr:polyprenyl synthetase family protein [Acidimicrobiales bacterium]
MIPTERVPEILTRARGHVAPALRAAIAVLSPELRPVAEYHLGWRDERGALVGGDGGKGVRPALSVLSAEAVGAEASVGVPGAVAVELVHNFSLIHDDVIDEDVERRHRPTVWALYGIGPAVIAGDALLALAQQVVLGPVPGPDAERAARRVADATAAMIAGQALDMAFERRDDVGVASCLAMEAGKTGALLGCAASIGAVLAGADEPVVEALDRFGVELGLSFQAVDDLLGIWGDPAATGKPAWSDLRQHKKSLPVAAALASGGAAVAELSSLLFSEHLEERDVERAAALVEECGGRDFATSEAAAHLATALAAVEGLALREESVAELVELAHFVVERQF